MQQYRELNLEKGERHSGSWAVLYLGRFSSFSLPYPFNSLTGEIEGRYSHLINSAWAGGPGGMTGKGSAGWLPAKFQQETEYLAASNLQRKIKLQKPLVETLHTFSTIAMPDRKN